MKAHTQVVTMNDIAKMANVSIATVSRVFGDSSKVSPKTKEKILALAEKYNFQPNESARTLAAKKSKLIAVVLPDVKNPYFTELLDYIEKLCVQNGYSMIFFNSDGDIKKEKSIIQQNVSGFGQRTKRDNEKRGAFYDYKSAHFKIERPAFTSVKTIDTTGAGDTFCACVLHFILESGYNFSKEKLEDALTFANAASSLITTKKGALMSMPEVSEIDALVKNGK